jgi:hypothetical protein
MIHKLDTHCETGMRMLERVPALEQTSDSKFQMLELDPQGMLMLGDTTALLRE